MAQVPSQEANGTLLAQVCLPCIRRAPGGGQCLSLEPCSEAIGRRPGASWCQVATEKEVGVLRPRLSWVPKGVRPLWEAISRTPGAHAGFPRFSGGLRSLVNTERGGEGSPRRL